MPGPIKMPGPIEDTIARHLKYPITRYYLPTAVSEQCGVRRRVVSDVYMDINTHWTKLGQNELFLPIFRGLEKTISFRGHRSVLPRSSLNTSNSRE